MRPVPLNNDNHRAHEPILRHDGTDADAGKEPAQKTPYSQNQQPRDRVNGTLTLDGSRGSHPEQAPPMMPSWLAPAFTILGAVITWYFASIARAKEKAKEDATALQIAIGLQKEADEMKKRVDPLVEDYWYRKGSEHKGTDGK